jgi:hypothetical protein
MRFEDFNAGKISLMGYDAEWPGRCPDVFTLIRACGSYWRGSIPEKNVCSLHSVQTASGARPASFPINNNKNLPRGKRGLCMKLTITSTSVEVKNACSYWPSV